MDPRIAHAVSALARTYAELSAVHAASDPAAGTRAMREMPRQMLDMENGTGLTWTPRPPAEPAALRVLPE